MGREEQMAPEDLMGLGPAGARGAAGKAQIVVQEGDVYTTTKRAPSIRGRQEMVLCQGDTHLSRITKHREVNQSVVNHTDIQLLNVTKRSSSKRNEVLLSRRAIARRFETAP